MSVTEQSVTFDEFERLILRAVPTAQIEEDNEGQLIVYTGLELDNDDNVMLFSDEYSNTQDARDYVASNQTNVEINQNV